MTEVAVVILNYNGRSFLEEFLPSVIKFSSDARIVVADNASTDDSIQVLLTRFSPRVELIEIDRNRGFCGGYNYALSHIDAEYFILLNSDIEVTQGWIEPIIRLLKSDSSIAAVQPKILSYHEKNKFEYAGAAGGYIDLMGYPFCRGRIFSQLEEDLGQYNDCRQVFWASGACLFIRSAAFKKVSGFDEDFFAHMEEIDLCWRLHQEGYNIYFNGESSVYHVGGGTLSASNPRKTYLNFRNGLSLLIKNLPIKEMIWKVPVRLTLDWLAALLFLFNGKLADAKAVMSAHFSFIGNLRLDVAKRNNKAKVGLTKATTGVLKRLIPFDYFVLKKKTFKELI